MMKIRNRFPEWEIQKNVIFTIYVRELKARFLHFRLGYLWAIGEPAAIILLLCSIRVAFGKEDIAGIPFPLFFASGLIPYLFFQTMVTQSLSSYESNKSLMNYRVVKPADTVIAKCLLEMIIYLTTGCIIFFIMRIIGYNYEFNNMLVLISSLTCLVGLTLGLALITSVIGPLWHESKKIVPILVKPLFFLSGIFFPASSIPKGYIDIMLWNPILHVSELVRESIFIDFRNPAGDISFLAKCALVSIFVGLITYHSNEKSLMTSGNIK
jgi:capsular polysaccharide transport system permease protein